MEEKGSRRKVSKGVKQANLSGASSDSSYLLCDSKTLSISHKHVAIAKTLNKACKRVVWKINSSLSRLNLLSRTQTCRNTCKNPKRFVRIYSFPRLLLSRTRRKHINMEELSKARISISILNHSMSLWSNEICVYMWSFFSIQHWKAFHCLRISLIQDNFSAIKFMHNALLTVALGIIRWWIPKKIPKTATMMAGMGNHERHGAVDVNKGWSGIHW